MINYPNNIKKNTNEKPKTFGNRGMTLEKELNDTNAYYLEKNIAVVYKKPTPVKVLKRVNEKIVDAYFEKPSTTDYNGLYKGKYIDFEAKETKQKSFPLSNIHNHQIKHIENVINNGGIAFIIVRFTVLNKTYLLFGEDLIKYLNKQKDKKSIPLAYFEEKGFLIKDKFNPKIDYIEIINKYGGNYEN